MSPALFKILTIVLVFCPASFGQMVYWANAHNAANPNDDKIQRANVDGTGIETLVTAGFNTPFGIALDPSADQMYFTDISGPDVGQVMRANLDGSGFEVLVSGLGAPAFIDVDLVNGKMYWASFVNFPAPDRIQRANLDGTGLETVVDGLSGAIGIAVDPSNGKVYWTEAGPRVIRRANLDGSALETIVTDTATRAPIDVAIDSANGKLYWSDGDQTGANAKIMRADLNGVNPEVLVSGLNNLGGIALDINAGKMYWVDTGTEKVQRANLDGSNVEDLVTTGLGNLGGIAVEPTPRVGIPAVSAPGLAMLSMLLLLGGSLIMRRAERVPT